MSTRKKQRELYVIYNESKDSGQGYGSDYLGDKVVAVATTYDLAVNATDTLNRNNAEANYDFILVPNVTNKTDVSILVDDIEPGVVKEIEELYDKEDLERLRKYFEQVYDVRLVK